MLIIKPLRLFIFLIIISFFLASCNNTNSGVMASNGKDSVSKKDSQSKPLPLDTIDFKKKMKAMSNGDTTHRWPPPMPYPLPGAVLPFKRIVAFYGNLYSKRMGILGEIPKDSMLKKLTQTMKLWQAADTSIPVIPALHYIAVSAQGSPGKDGMHRMRMPFHQIDTIVQWAKEFNALVFLDIQIGSSSVKAEVPMLEKYLLMPGVHFGIDPEFSMKHGEAPGKKIGTFSADDVNDAIDYLAQLVKKNNLPPKILIVHRFTQGMITNYQRIKKVPEVQVVMDMDGWGDKILKRSTYLRYIYGEPVEFTGFKLFYKNDIRKDKDGLYRPDELMKFIPKPVYIQYQ